MKTRIIILVNVKIWRTLCYDFPDTFNYTLSCQGTKQVKGILIDLPERGMIHLRFKAFKKMKGLRLFISRNAQFSEEPNFLSDELRVIDWIDYPGEYFPSNFRGKNLVILRMAHSRIKLLDGVQVKFLF